MSHATPPDAPSLVHFCLSGAAGAWEEFFRRYEPVLLREVRFALLRFGVADDPDLIRELVQEICASLIDRQGAVLAAFRWDCSLERYLSVVVVHRVVKHLERTTRLVSAKVDPADLAAARDLLAEEPSRLAETEESRSSIARALERLPLRDRLALRLHYWESLSAEQIAPLFSLSAGAVRVLLARARQRLRELLREIPCL